MTNPFNWQSTPSKLAKVFRPRNDKPGVLPPIILPNSSKFPQPKMQRKPK